MLTTASNGFNKFDVTNGTLRSSTAWQDNNMYRTSYLQQSEKNQPALQNSTKQSLKAFSENHKSITAREQYHHKQLENTDYINYDYNNLYRTSYTDMSTKLPKLINTFHIPGYGGFVPGMKAENPFAGTFTKLAKEQFNNFDEKRFNQTHSGTRPQWQYQPLSKTHGSHWNKRNPIPIQTSLKNHDFTTKGRETRNHDTCDKKSWIPISSFNGDMVRTEYRIQFNPKKEIHFKGPMASTGKLKRKEFNYKHT